MAGGAVVTGAAGDIGRAIVQRLVDRGMRVAALDVDQVALERLRENYSDGQVLPVQTDITVAAQTRVAIDTVIDAFGTVKLLVNNAGGISAPSLRTTTEESWSRDIELNLTGHWRCINALQDHMIANQAGVIVNIASVNALGVYGHPGYSAAKAGLLSLTRFAAVELGRFGIRAVAICPGSVRTQAWQERAAANPEIFDEIVGWYPSRAVCDPEDVARMVALVAMDAGALLNGAVVALDGGLTSGMDRVAALFTGGEI